MADNAYGSGGAEPAGVDAVKRCNCRKARCLKLYCVCFSAGVYCGGCACRDCMNTVQQQEVVWSERQRILQRSPRAFAPKVEQKGTGDVQHKKGCRCRKSRCLKKYCECFDAGVNCSSMCRCEDCQNQGDGGHNPPPPQQQQAVPVLHQLPAPVFPLISDSHMYAGGVVAVSTSAPAAPKAGRLSTRNSGQLSRPSSRTASPAPQAAHRSNSATDDGRESVKAGSVDVEQVGAAAAIPDAAVAAGDAVAEAAGMLSPVAAAVEQGPAAAAMGPAGSGALQPTSPHLDSLALPGLAGDGPTYSNAALAQLLGIPLPGPLPTTTTTSSLGLGLPGSLAPSPMAVPGLGDHHAVAWPLITSLAADPGPLHAAGVPQVAMSAAAPGVAGAAPFANQLAGLPGMVGPGFRPEAVLLPEAGHRTSGTGDAPGPSHTPAGGMPGTAVSRGPSPFSFAQGPSAALGPPPAAGPPVMQPQPLGPASFGAAGTMPPADAALQQAPLAYLTQPQLLLSQPAAARVLACRLGLDEPHQEAAHRAAHILQSLLHQAGSQLLGPGDMDLTGFPAAASMPELHPMGVQPQHPGPAHPTAAATAAPAATGAEAAASISQRQPSMATIDNLHLHPTAAGTGYQVAEAGNTSMHQPFPQQHQLAGSFTRQPREQHLHAPGAFGRGPQPSHSAASRLVSQPSASLANPYAGTAAAPAPTMSATQAGSVSAAGNLTPELVPSQPAMALPSASAKPALTTSAMQPTAPSRTGGAKAVRLGSGSFRFTGTGVMQLSGPGADAARGPGGLGGAVPAHGVLYSSSSAMGRRPAAGPAGYTTTLGDDLGKRLPHLTAGGRSHSAGAANMAAGQQEFGTAAALVTPGAGPAGSVVTTQSGRVVKRPRMDLEAGNYMYEASSEVAGSHAGPAEAAGPSRLRMAGGGTMTGAGGSNPGSPLRAATTATSSRARHSAGGAGRRRRDTSQAAPQAGGAGGGGPLDGMDSAMEVEAMQALFDLGSQPTSQQLPQQQVGCTAPAGGGGQHSSGINTSQASHGRCPRASAVK